MSSYFGGQSFHGAVVYLMSLLSLFSHNNINRVGRFLFQIQAIAQGLSIGGSSYQSYGGKLPTHEFSDNQPFPKAPHASAVTHKVTSVAGHVFNVHFQSEYQSWDSVDPTALRYQETVDN